MNQQNDIRLSFDQAAATYNEIRPNYPAEMFADLFELLPQSPHIVEVGPGTGQATRDLLANGALVHGIEIGPSMAAVLESNFATAKASGRLQVTVGDFEQVSLAADSFDAVFSATAYHWISPEAQTSRPVELLNSGGVLAIVDLIQVTSPAQPQDRIEFRLLRSRATHI